jgi:cell division protein FtsI (penicillin-binding protein 3)
MKLQRSPARPPDPREVRRRRPRRLIPRGDPSRRLGITLLAIIFVLTLFAGRLVQLQGMESGTYRKLEAKEQDKTILFPALRGEITGANGQVLAMTVATYTVYADPPEMTQAQQQQNAGKLSGLLGMTVP